jgi:hypothetical protein
MANPLAIESVGWFAVANNPLKYAVVAYFNLAKYGAKLRTARNPLNTSTGC